MSALKVTVIVPVYNSKRTLHETLHSVQAQAYRNWECLIIDDGSTDESGKIAKNFQKNDNRFIVFSKKNEGLSAARNNGIQRATGDFLQFLDSDDLISPTKLAEQVSAAKSEKASFIPFSNATYFLDCKDKQKKEYSWKPFNEKNLKSHIFEKNPVPVSSPLISLHFAKKVGYFDSSFECLEDWDFWIRCFLKGAKWQYVPTNDCRTMIRQAENSMSTNIKKMIKSEVLIYKKHYKQREAKKALNKKIRFHTKALVKNLIAQKGQESYSHYYFFLCLIQKPVK